MRTVSTSLPVSFCACSRIRVAVKDSYRVILHYVVGPKHFLRVAVARCTMEAETIHKVFLRSLETVVV